MKKLLILLVASCLVLSACGDQEERKLDNKNNTKSEDEESQKEDTKKDSGKKEDKSDSKDEKFNDEVANNENKQNETTQEKQKAQNEISTQQPGSNTNNDEGPTQQGNRPFGGIPPKGMTNEEYQILEKSIPTANKVSNEEYQQLLNEEVQRIVNENNHSIETPMGTFTPTNQKENSDQNQKIDLNNMPAGDFSTEGMSEEAKNKIKELTRQKDFEGLSQEEYNNEVSEIMNEEMKNN